MTLQRIAPATARALGAGGATVVLDLRHSAEFARGHPAGAIAVPFSQRGLGARALAVLARGATVIVTGNDDAAEVAALQLRESGIAVRGVLSGGLSAWRDAGLPVGTIGEVSVDELPRRATEATVIDVREPVEWATGHVPGALLIPLGSLRDSLAEVPRARGVIAICEAGVRSCTAASVLAAAGFTDVAHVPAGSSGYRRSGLPLAYPASEEVPS